MLAYSCLNQWPALGNHLAAARCRSVRSSLPGRIIAYTDICREVLGESATKQIAQVPLAARTVASRIKDLAEDIETQLLERIVKSTWFVIQCDESTDIENKAVLLVFVRYLYEEDIHEDILCTLLLPTITTASGLFKALNKYLEGKLNWSFCVGVCTDGAAAMTGSLSGLTVRIKEVAPQCEATHGVIRREMFASRKISTELHGVFHDKVEMNNLVKAHALTTRLFEHLCEDMDAKRKCLHFNTKVRWFSRGNH